MLKLLDHIKFKRGMRHQSLSNWQNGNLIFVQTHYRQWNRQPEENEFKNKTDVGIISDFYRNVFITERLLGRLSGLQRVLVYLFIYLFMNSQLNKMTPKYRQGIHKSKCNCKISRQNTGRMLRHLNEVIGLKFSLLIFSHLNPVPRSYDTLTEKNVYEQLYEYDNVLGTISTNEVKTFNT